ncbi:Transposable element Tcb2 transposase, partial [Stegodyphus mimosarum]
MMSSDEPTLAYQITDDEIIGSVLNSPQQENDSDTDTDNEFDRSEKISFNEGLEHGRQLIWREQRARYNQSHIVERHSYRGGGIMVWTRMSLVGHTDLDVFYGGTLTSVRYREKILNQYVHPYVAVIGPGFLLMDDIEQPHRARVAEEDFEGHGMEKMERPSESSDLNPIEPLWDYLGRQVAALSPPPRSLDELEQGLLRVWSLLPISLTDSSIDSMKSRYRQYIAARGGHISY